MIFIAILGCVSVWLLIHVQFVLNPQVGELIRKLKRAEFQGTAHQQIVQLALKRLTRQVRHLNQLAIVLILISLCLIPIVSKLK